MKTLLRLLLCCLLPSFALHAQPYCAPAYSSAGVDGDYIDGFQMASIANLGSGATAIPGYSNYIYDGGTTTPRLVPGTTYPVSITSGTYDPAPGNYHFYAVWVDLNHDLFFEADERLAATNTDNALQTVSVDLIIPAGTRNGYTGLRVMCVYNADPTDPCGGYTYGETEDYTVVIDDGTNCIPLYGSQATTGHFVSAVEMADLSWAASPAPPVWGYEDVRYAGAHLEAGTTNQLTVTTGSFAGPINVYVWLDQANDGFQSIDLVGGQTVTGPYGTATLSIVAPDNIGYSRMRVTCRPNLLGNQDGCQPDYEGHAVDFTLAVGHVGWPCMPLLGKGTDFGDAINNFILQGHDYGGNTTFPYYSIENSDEIRIDAGASELINIGTGAFAPENYGLMLDMNDDGDFSDANEILGNLQSSSGGQVIVSSITIPANCPPGQHILRIRSNDASLPLADPCDDSSYGNMMDIVIVVEDPNGPCIPFVGYWTVTGDFIDGVQLGGAQNIGTGGTFGPAYHDYPSPSIGLLMGSTDTLHITGGALGGDSYTAWIDYNGDNDFADANESLGWIGIADPYTTGDLVFTVPPGTTPGIKRLRVRCAPAVLGDACLGSQCGETEDYRVSIEVNTGLAASAATDFRLLPTDDGAQLVCDAAYLGSTFTVLDATGRVLINGRIVSDRTTISMADMAKGTYTVVLTNDGQPSAKRFVW